MDGNKEPKTDVTSSHGTIIPKIIEEEMKQSYLDYAMSVIVGRALPDVRDGLKPVHRRILFAMYEMGMDHNKPFKKSARIVGTTLGQYHPHGDIAVYDALVRLVQDFSLRYPLIQGQGNFGCFTKDTKVMLTDGRKLSFEDLIKEQAQGKKNYTFTINKLGNVAVAEIKNPRLTIKNAEIMKVILDTGEEIKCTLNHKFMLRDGTYKEAQYLQENDSLMPCYFKKLSHNKVEQLPIPIIEANHKIKQILFLHQYEEVYDLTIDNTHNFALAAGVFVHNSIDGDNAAAMRYSEARLNKLSEELLEDIDKETIKFQPNFDNSLQEPTVLPSKAPNLLLNGSSGIAVGMATNIPPHNMNELCDGIIAMIDNPNISVKELMHHIKGPDFPTGAIICGASGIRHAYETGRGRLIVRAKTEMQERKIIVKEIPYMVNKAEMIVQMADLVKDKKIEGISDIRDESDRKGIHVVIELKKDAHSEVVLNQLFKHSRLQTTFGVIMLALVDNAPQVLNLNQLITHFIHHRQIVVRKRTQFDLNKASERAHILEGLIIALNNLDSTILIIRQADAVEQARDQLIAKLQLSKKQAEAILDMKLSRLTNLEQGKIKTEHKELLITIETLKSILADEKRILSIIKQELLHLKENFGDKRRTVIEETESVDIETEDMIKHESMVLTITHSGYIKRLALKLYRQQKRGGKGIIAATTKDEDFIEDIFVADTHAYILFFTNKGKVHWLKVYDVPEAGRQAKGKAIINLLQLEENEKITAFVPVDKFDSAHFLIMATKKGTVKKTILDAYSNPRRGGIIAITLEQGDELINVALTDGQQQIMLATKNGMAVRFKEETVRPTGRSAMGVRGATLRDDEVIDLVVCDDTKTLLTITENGYGKRTLVSEYRLTNRGGVGVKNIICSERNGKVVAVKSVTDNDQLMFISRNGIVIRTTAKEISTIGRATQGLRLMRMEANDKVVAAAKIISEKDEIKAEDENIEDLPDIKEPINPVETNGDDDFQESDEES